MSKFLIPVDGSVHMEAVNRYLSQEFLKNNNMQVELIYVRPRVSRYITRFLTQGNMLAWFEEQASIAYGLSSRDLKSKGIPFQINYPYGAHVQDVSHIAKSLDCSHIVVSGPSLEILAHLFNKTSAEELIARGDLPVIIVPRQQAFSNNRGTGIYQTRLNSSF